MAGLVVLPRQWGSRSAHVHWPSRSNPQRSGQACPAEKQPSKHSRGNIALNRHEVIEAGERARASPGKAESYLEESQHRLSFEGSDLCMRCLMQMREKGMGNNSINRKNWCKVCQ